MKACTHAYVNKPRNEPKRFHHVLSLTSLHGPVACEAAGASLSSCLSASSSETDRCCAASPAGDDGLGLDRLQRDLFERLLARETRDMARLGRDFGASAADVPLGALGISPVIHGQGGS